MKRLIAVMLCVSLCGCAGISMSQATGINRKNLIKLSIGMNKPEAVKIMGTKTLNSYYADVFGQRTRVTINNPYSSEIFTGNGRTLEALYYAVDVKTYDTLITKDELIPLVFEGGRLIGWGWSFLESNLE